MNSVKEIGHRLPPNASNGVEERLVPVKQEPSVKTATEHYNEQQDLKKTEDVTIQQIQIIKRKKNKDTASENDLRNLPKAIEPTPNLPKQNAPAILKPTRTVQIQKVSHVPPPSSHVKNEVIRSNERSVPIQKVSGTPYVGSLRSNVVETPERKENDRERVVPVQAQKRSDERVIRGDENSNRDGRSVPVKYLPDATAQNEFFTEQEFKERQTLTVDRIQYVKTSKKKDVPMKVSVNISPKELSEAELSVQKKPKTPPQKRKEIVYRNEAKPTEVSNFKTLQRRASDSAVEKSSARNANTQTLSRSFLWSSLRRKAYTPQPRDGAARSDGEISPRPTHAKIKVATVNERRVKSIAPAPLQIPVHHVNRSSSASSESTLEPSSAQTDFPASKVGREGRQATSNPPTLLHTVVKSPSSLPATLQPSPVNRETQTSPAYPLLKTAGYPEMQIRFKSPVYLRATHNPRKMLSPSPTSSLSSWGTSELCRMDSFPLSPPDSSFGGSWSSLPCPSLSSVTSQCDTDCLLIADARTGVIPDALSDAETDELLEADPFARGYGKIELSLARPKAKQGALRDPPALKVNDTAVFAIGKSAPKQPQEVVMIAPALLDESVTEHSIFETSQETVILNKELQRSKQHCTIGQENRERSSKEKTKTCLNDGCAQNFMSFYSLYVYPE